MIITLDTIQILIRIACQSSFALSGFKVTVGRKLENESSGVVNLNTSETDGEYVSYSLKREGGADVKH